MNLTRRKFLQFGTAVLVAAKFPNIVLADIKVKGKYLINCPIIDVEYFNETIITNRIQNSTMHEYAYTATFLVFIPKDMYIHTIYLNNAKYAGDVAIIAADKLKFTNLPLENFGNRIPNISIEVS